MYLIRDVFNFFEIEEQLNLMPFKINFSDFTATIFKINKIMGEFNRSYTTYSICIKSPKYSLQIEKR